jgi:excisionase family DNA binding protein
MSKKYLSIEEAAEQLGIASAELNRLREKGVIRAFADRGTWKFKEEDVEKLGRSRQADSDPDVPLHQPDDEGSGADLLFTDEDSLGTQPTIISKKQPDDSGSDSDVRLIFDDSLQVTEPKAGPPQDDSDSDVKLAGGAPAAPAKAADDSDSDVKLAGTAAGAPGGGSDSDVKLVTDDVPTKESSGSDSDVRLVSSDSSGEVKLAGSGSSGSVPIMDEEGGSTILVDPAGSSVMDDESGISLGEGSDIPLASDSGISLERPNDSGISLSDESSIVLTDDSGISLAGEKSSNIKADSGISLAKGDSGISLSKGDSGISVSKQPAGKKKGAPPSPSDSDDLTGTVPLMDAPLAEDEDLLDTQMEVPSLGDSSESGEIFGTGEGDSTNVITLDDDEDPGYDVTSEIPRGAAALEEDEEAMIDDEPVDVSDELVGEDDELAEDVFGAEDEDFASDVESGESQAELPIAPRGMVAAEQDWGMGTHVALWASTALMVACGTVLFDMVRNMWHTDAASHNPVASMLLDMFKNI